MCTYSLGLMMACHVVRYPRWKNTLGIIFPLLCCMVLSRNGAKECVCLMEKGSFVRRHTLLCGERHKVAMPQDGVGTGKLFFILFFSNSFTKTCILNELAIKKGSLIYLLQCITVFHEHCSLSKTLTLASVLSNYAGTGLQRLFFFFLLQSSLL